MTNCRKIRHVHRTCTRAVLKYYKLTNTWRNSTFFGSYGVYFLEVFYKMLRYFGVISFGLMLNAHMFYSFKEHLLNNLEIFQLILIFSSSHLYFKLMELSKVKHLKMLCLQLIGILT